MSLFKEKTSLAIWSLTLSVFTVAVFHGPFFRQLRQSLEGGANGVILTVSAAVLLLVLDFLLYYLLVYLFRFVGKCIVAFTLFGDAVMYKEYEQGLCSITEQQKFVLDTILGLNEEPKVIEKEIIVEIPAEIPTVICDVIMEHIKDLQIDAEAQKKIWRYFRKVKLDEEERKLFG